MAPTKRIDRRQGSAGACLCGRRPAPARPDPIPAASDRPLWCDPRRPGQVFILDQRSLPGKVRVRALRTVADAAAAIHDMAVRGAPLIGVTAAWGMALAARSTGATVETIARAAACLRATRPTAQDLGRAVDRQLRWAARGRKSRSLADVLEAGARRIEAESVRACRRIGNYGLSLIEAIHRAHPRRPVNILTHCNAGRLACVELGTATAPIYLAHRRGIPVHVWVDETRPRNQGAALTAWELGHAGVPHTLIVDNAGGHLMQHGRVDLVLVGADRITRRGDAANKIGTYLKALAARDNGVPFYVAAPASTFDPSLADGVKEIPIENRDAEEVRFIPAAIRGRQVAARICPHATPAVNPGFDVTPARLLTGILTDRGLCTADEESLCALFPEWEIPE